jgi:hypothetical protein
MLSIRPSSRLFRAHAEKMILWPSTISSALAVVDVVIVVSFTIWSKR